MIRSSILAAGLLAAGLLPATGATAAQGYDNPTLGAAPCVVLNRYEVSQVATPAAGDSGYLARAHIENICGRALEVSFCFLYAQPVDGTARSCSRELLRPWSDAAVRHDASPVRVTGPDYQWRFLPVR